MSDEPIGVDSGIETYIDACLTSRQQEKDAIFARQLGELERILALELTAEQLEILHLHVISPNQFTITYRGKTIVGGYRGSDRTAGGWIMSCADLFNSPHGRPGMLWEDLVHYLTDIRLALEKLDATAAASAEKQ